MQEIDKQIHDLILNNESYMDILYRDDRWEVLYNLSPLRENLLEWYPFDNRASLLEYGGEYGALTCLFARKTSSVVTLCDNDLQTESIKHRCKELSNVQVVKSIEEIEQRFDYITIINPKTDIQEIIAGVMKFLKDDGKIILACDNSLALKYFLDDEVVKSTICTSKNCITKYLIQQKFSNIEFYYPSPDFRLPNVIYSERYLPQQGDIRNVNVRFDAEKYQVLNEDYIYDAICGENIYENMANSFLIIASR